MKGHGGDSDEASNEAEEDDEAQADHEKEESERQEQQPKRKRSKKRPLPSGLSSGSDFPVGSDKQVRVIAAVRCSTSSLNMYSLLLTTSDFEVPVYRAMVWYRETGRQRTIQAYLVSLLPPPRQQMIYQLASRHKF
jgi:hypothetical protein|eukprot:SAG25_NODE_462_length_7803_cov_21.430945_3_plen_136_part_00